MALIVVLGTAISVAAASPATAAATRRPTARSTRARDTLVTTAIVVRHAEKNTDWAGSDPPLSPAGRERAEALALALKDARIDRIYVTHFIRNRDTAEPLAKLTGDSIEVVDQGNAAALAKRIWNVDRGRTVLIVGHSDTVPAIVRALGGIMPDLESGEFGAMIIVTRRGNEPPHTLRLRYGAP